MALTEKITTSLKHSQTRSNRKTAARFEKLGIPGGYPRKFSALWDKIVTHHSTPTKFSVLWRLNFKMMSFCKVDPRCGFNLVQCIYNGNFYSKTLLFNWYCSFNLGYLGNWVFWRWVFWISGILALVILGLSGGTPEYIRKARLGLLRRLPVVESEKTRQYYEQQSITRYSSLQKRSFKMP